MDVWDTEFIVLAEQIDQYRELYLQELIPTIHWVISELSSIEGFEFKYYAGWDTAKPLADILASDRQRDILAKVTGHGPHRADLRVRYNKLPANDVLSRGQVKILVTAMQIAQGFLFNERTGCQCLYLLDDLPSELDLQHREKVGELLNRLGAQTFITGVVREDVLSTWPKQSEQTSMFHVEHGGITQE